MKDIRNILLTALVPALKVATGKNVYTRMPKAAGITYPYIFVGDKYQTEDGPKTSFRYQLDVQIVICHMNLNDISALTTDMDNVLSIVNNGSQLLTLANPYKVMSCELISSNDIEIETEVGTESLGIIRILFKIE